MKKETLSSQISRTIRKFEALADKNPADRDLNNTLSDLYAALQQAEGREWDAHVQEYQQAKLALDDAYKATQVALDDLSKTAEVIAKVASAIEKVLKASAKVATLVV